MGLLDYGTASYLMMTSTSLGEFLCVQCEATWSIAVWLYEAIMGLVHAVQYVPITTSYLSFCMTVKSNAKPYEVIMGLVYAVQYGFD